MRMLPFQAFVLSCLLVANLLAADHSKDSLPTVRENLAQKKAVLVDVREQAEWDRGHLAGAVLLPLSTLKTAADSKPSLQKLPKEQIIYTHCAVGIRSLEASELLKKQGYDVRPLKAGYTELLKAGFPQAQEK